MTTTIGKASMLVQAMDPFGQRPWARFHPMSAHLDDISSHMQPCRCPHGFVRLDTWLIAYIPDGPVPIKLRISAHSSLSTSPTSCNTAYWSSTAFTGGNGEHHRTLSIDHGYSQYHHHHPRLLRLLSRYTLCIFRHEVDDRRCISGVSPVPRLLFPRL